MDIFKAFEYVRSGKGAVWRLLESDRHTTLWVKVGHCEDGPLFVRRGRIDIISKRQSMWVSSFLTRDDLNATNWAPVTD